MDADGGASYGTLRSFMSMRSGRVRRAAVGKCVINRYRANK